MAVFTLLVGFIASVGAALVLVPLARRLGLRAGMVDHPDDGRKAHGEAIPNVGGLAIVAAVCVGVGVMTLVRWRYPGAVPSALVLPSPLVLLGGVLIALVGFWDDLRDIHHDAKFAAQLWVTALAFKGGARVEVFDMALGGGVPALIVSVLLTGVWMVGMMNAVNLIDGLDGLAAGVVIIALAGLAGAFAVNGDVGSLVLVVAVAGALVGFLRFNGPPASVFMGDGGSLFIGYVLGAYALRGTAHPNSVLTLVIPVVAMGIPVVDTGVSLLRRMLSGEPLFFPDRGHLHHRLLERMSPRRALATLYGMGVALAVGAVTMAALPTGPALVVLAVSVVGMVAFLVRVGYVPRPSEAVRALRHQPHDEPAPNEADAER